MKTNIELLDGNSCPYSKIKMIIESKNLDQPLELFFIISENGTALLETDKLSLPNILIQDEIEFATEELNNFLDKDTKKYLFS